MRNQDSYGQQKISDVIAKWERRMALEGRWAEDSDGDDGASSVAQSSIASTGSPGARSRAGMDVSFDVGTEDEVVSGAGAGTGAGDDDKKKKKTGRPARSADKDTWYEDDGFLDDEDARPDVSSRPLLVKGHYVAAFADILIGPE